MHATIEIQLLEVFQILACSQLNRQRMMALGILPAVARVMKVRLAGSPYCDEHALTSSIEKTCENFHPVLQLHKI